MVATKGLLCSDVFGQSSLLQRLIVVPVQRVQTCKAGGAAPASFCAQPAALGDVLLALSCLSAQEWPAQTQLAAI